MSLLRSGIDSLRLRDSLAARLHPQFVPDSALLLKTDSLPAALGAPDSLAGRKDLRPRRDTISLSGVSWISLVAPGFGQIYNKQYWKLPILYGTVGAGLTLFFHENNTYKPLKRQYNALLENGTARTEELDDVQSRMIRSNTRQADISRAYGRLLPLLPGRCGGQLPLRRLPRKESHDTGHDLPRCRTSL